MGHPEIYNQSLWSGFLVWSKFGPVFHPTFSQRWKHFIYIVWPMSSNLIPWYTRVVYLTMLHYYFVRVFRVWTIWGFTLQFKSPLCFVLHWQSCSIVGKLHTSTFLLRVTKISHVCTISIKAWRCRKRHPFSRQPHWHDRAGKHRFH